MTITKALTRFYRDNNQLSAIVHWSDGAITYGRARKPKVADGVHMTALFNRAKREGLPITHEIW